MTEPSPKQLQTISPYIESGPSDQGEYRLRCPMHGERRASASVNFEKGWYCNVCEVGGSVTQLVKFINSLPDDDPRKVKSTSTNLFDLDSARRNGRTEADDEILSEAKVIGWHEHLKSNPDRMATLTERRLLDASIVDRFTLGFDTKKKRYTLPVYDQAGRLVNVRRYSTMDGSHAKMINAQGHGSPPRLYPLANLEHDEVVIYEGELDALLSTQLGIPGISGTGGAKRWDPSWAPMFKGKIVFLSYDNDDDGRAGARKAAKALSAHARHVVTLPAWTPEKGSDLTDYVKAGGSSEDVRAAMQAALEAVQAEEVFKDDDLSDTPSPAVIPVRVVGSMDSATNGKPLQMAVTITGRKDPTYSIPSRIRMECTMDAGPKCKNCPMMNEWDGDSTAVIEPTDVQVIADFIDARKSSALDVIRSATGIQKCNRLEVEELDAFTVEELFVMSSVDASSHESTDYTQRRIYNIGSNGSSPTNMEAIVVGTTVPSPKDRRNEFFSWELRDAVTSLDTFKMDEEMHNRLRIFQVEPGQSPLDKCWDIATDLAANVTMIMGRERLHIAMDLVWHSILRFDFEGKPISRGWLELLVVGDTRTGKSETAIKLTEHYGLGHVIGCEGATFAGLVGGVKEIGNSRTISWGELTLNDRRQCTLDEVSGLHQDIIGQMSDVRSRGKAQITKIETATTNARVRAIWLSNPRPSKFVDEKYTDGIDVIRQLIGNPEDIARFDFAMSVSKYDVPTDRINDPNRETVPHRYTADLCRDLVLWCWSRRADQVTFTPDAYQHVFTVSRKLSSIYVEDPPLIQGSNVREKIARLSVALAARVFSTEDGETLVVRKEHVTGAAEFLHKLYGYDNFGYLRVSKRAARNREIAKERRAVVKRYLREAPRFLEFLMNHRGTFRSQDAEEMTHLMRDEIATILGKLSHDRMISKDKSQIVIEPELRQLLKELEDEAARKPRPRKAGSVRARSGKS